jgi:Nucleoside 2-deoxyribosyltransferase like
MKIAIEIKAPNKYNIKDRYSLFLAGAIDSGSARPWQNEVARKLDDLRIYILNPRRDDWDSNWVQSADNPKFREQVEWELNAQDAVDMVLFVFTKESKAPITFLELGLFGPTKDAIVCAEEGFYRQGNLDIVCKRYGIPIYHNLDETIMDLRKLLEEHSGG